MLVFDRIKFSILLLVILPLPKYAVSAYNCIDFAHFLLRAIGLTTHSRVLQP
jgi:hypothetical protein